MKTYTQSPAAQPRTIQGSKSNSEHADQNNVLQDYAKRTKPNRTGIPDDLKSSIEKLSGYSMDDVRVYYNSAKPAQLNAEAYAQGNEIYIGPGQERHLPEEVWHIVEKKQGRVKSQKQISGVDIDDTPDLEKEAKTMGEYAAGISSDELPDIELKDTPANDQTVQRHMGIEMELDVPVFQSTVDPTGTLTPDAYGCLYSIMPYTRTDISGEAATTGYNIQLDHGHNGKELNTLNNEYKTKHNLPITNPGVKSIANLEFVIGGASGADEEDTTQRAHLIASAGNAAAYISNFVGIVRTGVQSIGNYRVGVPVEDLFNHDGAHADLRPQYEALRSNLTDSVYMQVTAGVSPAKLMNFIKPEKQINPPVRDNNPLTFPQWFTKINGKIIMYDHVNKYASDGYGLQAYLKSQAPDELVNKVHYHNILKGYVMLMTQEIFSRLLRCPTIGNWGENGGSTIKNTVFMLPQSATSSIIPNSAPPILLNFLTANKEVVKSIIIKKIDSIYTGGFFGINIEDCINAMQSVYRVANWPKQDQLEPNIKHVLRDHDKTEPDEHDKSKTRKIPVKGFIHEIVDSFFSQIGGDEHVEYEGMSPHNFTYHPVDAAQPDKGKKIPIEFRYVREYDIPSTAIVYTVTDLIKEVRSRNR